MNLNYDRSVTFPNGFLANGTSAGIKENGSLDLGLVVSENTATTAGVFTKNKFTAAPVILCAKNLLKSKNKCRAIIVNSGCANALTGKAGLKYAEAIISEIAKELHVPKAEVLVASTGVIGKQLPVENIIGKVPDLVRGTTIGGDSAFSQSILTTDKFPKRVGIEVTVSKDKKFRIGAAAKGAGMIHPNMATMLCFVTTDAGVEKKVLQRALNVSVANSFNTITVDGDTSTNDSVFLLANGASGVKISSASEKKIFEEALTAVLVQLAMMIVRDGEGATRFVKLNIESAATFEDAVKVGRAVGTSPLVKTAIFGGDPNWGRVLSAVGNSDARFDPKKVELKIGDVCVFRRNEPQETDPARLSDLFSKKEIEMTIKLNSGRDSAQVYTCDLSYDYVKINGEYTT
ncbi:MAG TPA: bifunctional glutamate N-acetyltransferase/amino-acid acetyltransferase ArgJ [Candidatus Acidoferrales bacterium]|nr:bifunctional glutamate N-acetyltransferase/amino-acid acetyltransferase ArgJ [Candidatus Acidoferrales bacterium]